MLLHCCFLVWFFLHVIHLFYTLTCMFLFCLLKSKTKPYFPPPNQNFGNEPDVD